MEAIIFILKNAPNKDIKEDRTSLLRNDQNNKKKIQKIVDISLLLNVSLRSSVGYIFIQLTIYCCKRRGRGHSQYSKRIRPAIDLYPC